jgi:hypothetical protein
LTAFDDVALGQQDQVRRALPVTLVPPETLTKQSLGAVALDGASEPAAGGQPQTIMATAILCRHQTEQGTVDPDPSSKHAAIIGPGDQTLPGPQGHPCATRGPQRQAPILFRPFCRRLLRTRRPPLVRIRTRKPWVRFRFRLFGWNVRFMVSVLEQSY